MRANSRSRLATRLMACSLALFCAGCPSAMKKRDAQTVAPVPLAEPQPPACEELQREIDRLTRERIEGRGEQQDLQQRNAALQLRLLEKEALVKALQGQVAGQQAEFDEAIAEVVRSKGKLRSVESKAEAASDLAEAEIALAGVRSQYAAEETPPALVQAEQLLANSGREFEAGNFGGALYLTSQARAKIRAAELHSRLHDNVELLAGEVRFAAPVGLKVTKVSNVRSAPGLEADVLATLQPGTLLTGYSYKGDWVRVGTSGRATGWVFQALLGGLE
jgi:hypothetical protein